jgi:hypothetical protein
MSPWTFPLSSSSFEPFCSPALLLPPMQFLPPAAAMQSAALHLLLALSTRCPALTPGACITLAGHPSSLHVGQTLPHDRHALSTSSRRRPSFPLQILLPRAVWNSSPNLSPTSQAKPAALLAEFQPMAWFCALPPIPSGEPCCRSGISPGCAVFPVIRGLVVLRDSWVGLGRCSLRRNVACAAVRRSTMAPLRGIAPCLSTFLRGCGCSLCWSRCLGSSGITGTGTPPWPSSCSCVWPSTAPMGYPMRGNRRGGSYLGSPGKPLTQGWEPGSLAAGKACGAAILASQPWLWAKGGEEETGDPTCKRRTEREGWMCKGKRVSEGFSAKSCS